MIVERVFAVGVLAVRQHRWQQARELATQKCRREDFRWYGSWLRHGLVMAARGGLLDVRNEQGQQISLSLMLLAQEHAQRLPALRPDVAADDEDLLSSICQFDLLAALAAIDASGELDDRSWYTNFARFDWSRAEPALERLLSDSVARAAISPQSEARLAEAVQAISSRAKHETFRYMVFGRWQSPALLRSSGTTGGLISERDHSQAGGKSLGSAADVHLRRQFRPATKLEPATDCHNDREAARGIAQSRMLLLARSRSGGDGYLILRVVRRGGGAGRCCV